MGKNKIFLRFLSLWVAGSIAVAPVFAEGPKVKEPSKSSESPGKKYVYSKKEENDIRFFPVEKARWNGYEVAIEDWDQLTDFLKMRFLRDAKTEIEVRESSVILVSNMILLVKAMDESIKELQADPKLKGMPVLAFFYMMLLRNHAIKKAWTLVKLSKAKANPKNPAGAVAKP
jgi:hypothetical protein